MSPRRTAVDRKQGGLPSWLVFAGMAAVAIIVVFVGAEFLGQMRTSSQSVAVGSTSGIVRTGRTEGDPNAPIELVEFSDFQ